MKKLIFLLAIILVYSCKMPCIMGQLPNQVVYYDQNCKAVLGDYRSLAVVMGGCSGFTVTQTPAPGTVITSNTTVTLRAIGNNGKPSKPRSLEVAVADTITPRFVDPVGMADTLFKKGNDLYDIADSMIIQAEVVVNNTFPFDSFPGMVRDSSYAKKILLTASSPKPDGTRSRIIMPVDSIVKGQIY
jgi:hypothetical protein